MQIYAKLQELAAKPLHKFHLSEELHGYLGQRNGNAVSVQISHNPDRINMEQQGWWN